MSSVTARILRSRALGAACEGSDYYAIEPDLVLGHEATIALTIGRLKQAGKRIWNPAKCFFAADHFVPPATEERAAILRRYLDFIAEEGVPQGLLFRGISHQLLIEDSRCRPGAVICGADSHTTTGGAFGAFSAGFGSTDILVMLATGRAYVTTPKAIKVVISGPADKHTSGKDMALQMMQQLGEGGGGYRALEFVDDTGVSMAARATLCNMAVDCGAKNGLVVPDEITRQAMIQRDGQDPGPLDQWAAGPDSAYERVMVLRADGGPLVARPGSPADVVAAGDAEPETVHQVFVGSCCGGRLEDLRDAADVLRGKRVLPGLRMVVTPASQAVYRAAVDQGIVTTLIDAGAMVTASACGACGGIDKGILGPGEVCVSTSNRNFRGRMGSNDARIWLASARTAAAAALTGRVCDPREVE